MGGTRVELSVSNDLDRAGWDRAVEIERSRQMWSLSRPGKEG